MAEPNRSNHSSNRGWPSIEEQAKTILNAGHDDAAAHMPKTETMQWRSALAALAPCTIELARFCMLPPPRCQKTDRSAPRPGRLSHDHLYGGILIGGRRLTPGRSPTSNRSNALLGFGGQENFRSMIGEPRLEMIFG